MIPSSSSTEHNKKRKVLPYILAGLSPLIPSSIQLGKKRKRVQKHLFLMASSKIITAAFEKLPRVPWKLFGVSESKAEEVRKGEVATFPLLWHFFISFSSLFPHSSSSLLFSDWILGKQDQGRALILREANRVHPRSMKNIQAHRKIDRFLERRLAQSARLTAHSQ